MTTEASFKVRMSWKLGAADADVESCLRRPASTRALTRSKPASHRKRNTTRTDYYKINTANAEVFSFPVGWDVSVSQVTLTGRPLRNDQECGKNENANLATRHVASSVARGVRVIPHGGVEKIISSSDSQRWVNAGRGGSAPTRSGCGSSACPPPVPPSPPDRPVKATQHDADTPAWL